MPDALAVLAERQWQDYQMRTPGTCFAEPGHALDLEQAYRLQAAIASLRTNGGDRIVGYKVGCTGPGTTQQFGMAGPIRGFLFQSEMHQHGTTLDSPKLPDDGRHRRRSPTSPRPHRAPCRV